MYDKNDLKKTTYIKKTNTRILLCSLSLSLTICRITFLISIFDEMISSNSTLSFWAHHGVLEEVRGT
jgi:hypothetical protein